MEMTVYLKFRLHKELIKKIKRVHHSVSSYERCRMCMRKIVLLKREDSYLCSTECKMSYDDKIFRDVFGC